MRTSSHLPQARAFGSHKLVLTLSSCVPALMMAAPALAQDSDASAAASINTTPAANEILVTGFRQSIESAMEKKRADVRVTDGISAEDIGKFPAENITEAIQRISGVQMSNINGRGSTISIRGLGPQYALTTINGQTFKSADFTDGFRYDIIQTELASAIEVVKSPTAAMDTGGLSGTVNISTPKPLDYNGRSLILSIKGQNSEYAGGKITPKVSGSYVGKFLDDTLGVYVNLGYQKLKDRADYFWMDRWTTMDVDGEEVTVGRRPRYRRIDRDTTRLMASGGLQWKPNDRLEINATGIFARDKTDYDVNQQVFLFDTSNLVVNSVKNGVATSVTASDFTMENNRQHEDRNLTSQGYTLSGKWTGDNGWVASSALNYTVGTTYQREAAAIVGITIPSATIDFSNPNAVSFDVDTDLSDASNYAASSLTRNEYPNGATRKMRSSESSAQFDVSKDTEFGPFSKFSAGAKYRHEIFNRYVSRHDMTALADAPSADSSVFPDMTTDNYSVSGFLGGSSLIQSAWVAPNLSAYKAALAAAGITVPDIFAPEASYHVDRYMPSVYLMADIDTSIGSLPIRGNVGVRYEHTRQVVQGNVTEPRDDGYDEVQQKIGEYTVRQNYGNVLPSLSLVAEPTSNLQIRFAAAKVLVRPFMDSKTSMAQTTSTSANTDPVGTNTVTVDLGQASLKPLTAKQLDLGAEWYFDQGSAITIDGFYKWIKNGTYSTLICPSSYNGTSLSTNADSECVDSSGNIYDITQTLNDPSIVRIKGFEVSWTQSFDRFLPVDGFGLMANFTRVFPQNEDPDSGYTVRNLSKVTWNVVPYWENQHFNIRASINYRSSYKQTNADSFFAYAGHVVRGRTQIDLSGGYSPNDYLSFSAGVVNLNNTSEEAYYEDSSIWQESSHYGRSFYLSATVKL